MKSLVQNKESEIKTLTNPKLWQLCLGSSNPGKKLTNGESIQCLVDNLLKLRPCWLREDECKWLLENNEIKIQFI